MKTYSEKLLDPRWQKKRLEIFFRDGWACRECGDTTATLVIHHHYYAAAKEPWEYPDDAFSTLCDPCHKEAKTIKIDKALKDYLFILESQIKNEYDHELSRKIDCVHFLSGGI